MIEELVRMRSDKRQGRTRMTVAERNPLRVAVVCYNMDIAWRWSSYVGRLCKTKVLSFVKQVYVKFTSLHPFSSYKYIVPDRRTPRNASAHVRTLSRFVQIRVLARLTTASLRLPETRRKLLIIVNDAVSKNSCLVLK